MRFIKIMKSTSYKYIGRTLAYTHTLSLRISAFALANGYMNMNWAIGIKDKKSITAIANNNETLHHHSNKVKWDSLRWWCCCCFLWFVLCLAQSLPVSFHRAHIQNRQHIYWELIYVQCIRCGLMFSVLYKHEMCAVGKFASKIFFCEFLWFSLDVLRENVWGMGNLVIFMKPFAKMNEKIANESIWCVCNSDVHFLSFSSKFLCKPFFYCKMLSLCIR